MEAIVAEIMALVKKSGVVVPREAFLELYHHMGIERFREIGAGIITCFNKNYCKKIIVLLPGQTLPMHAHRIKEETFTLLYGDANGMSIGDTKHVEPVRPHSFYSVGGAVIEEISTKYLDGDSVYEIDVLPVTERKTKAREFK